MSSHCLPDQYIPQPSLPPRHATYPTVPAFLPPLAAGGGWPAPPSRMNGPASFLGVMGFSNTLGVSRDSPLATRAGIGTGALVALFTLLAAASLGPSAPLSAS